MPWKGGMEVRKNRQGNLAFFCCGKTQIQLEKKLLSG